MNENQLDALLRRNPHEGLPTRAEVRRRSIESALISLGWLLKEDERMCLELQQLVNDATESLMEIDDKMLECDE